MRAICIDNWQRPNFTFNKQYQVKVADFGETQHHTSSVYYKVVDDFGKEVIVHNQMFDLIASSINE